MKTPNGFSKPILSIENDRTVRKKEDSGRTLVEDSRPSLTRNQGRVYLDRVDQED